MFNACVIEDDPVTVSALRAALSRLGCEVAVSEGSQDGLTRLSESNRIDVAFVSLSLRSASARGVAQHIRAQHPSSKVFFVTSWDGELDRRILDAEGVSGVIRRPPRFSEVKRMLIEHLG